MPEILSIETMRSTPFISINTFNEEIGTLNVPVEINDLFHVKIGLDEAWYLSVRSRDNFLPGTYYWTEVYPGSTLSQRSYYGEGLYSAYMWHLDGFTGLVYKQKEEDSKKNISHGMRGDGMMSVPFDIKGCR